MAGSEHLQVPQSHWNFQAPESEGKFDKLDPILGPGQAKYDEDQQKLRVAYGEGDPVEEGHYSRSLPRPRKAWIIFVGLSNLLSFIFITIAIVHPTPSFGTMVLFTMRSFEEASLIRRGLLGIDPTEIFLAPQQVDDLDAGKPPLLANAHWSHTYSSDHRASDSQESIGGLLSRLEFTPRLSVRALDNVQVRTRLSTTYTTTTATSLVKATSKTKATTTCSTSVSTRQPKPKPKPKPKSSKASSKKDTFVALYVGALGACIDQKDTFRICSSASLVPNFRGTYEESTLPEEVIDLLPQGTSGGSIFLIVGLVLYLLAVLAFILAYKGAVTARTAKGHRAYVNARYIYFLGFATFANLAGMVLTMTCLLIFRKVFQEATEEIPKLPYELFPNGGGATTPLSVTCGTGAVSTLACIYILVGDMRLIISENIAARQRQAKAEERLEKKRQRRSESDAFRSSNRNKAVATSLPTDFPTKTQAEAEDKATANKKRTSHVDEGRRRSRGISLSFMRKLVPTRFLDVAKSAEDKSPKTRISSASQGSEGFTGRDGSPGGGKSERQGRHARTTDIQPGFADVARAQDETSPPVRTRYSDPDEGDWQPEREPIPAFKRPRRSTLERLKEVFRMRMN